MTMVTGAISRATGVPISSRDWTWQQALNNADNYAYFAYKAMQAKFRTVIVTSRSR